MISDIFTVCDSNLNILRFQIATSHVESWRTTLNMLLSMFIAVHPLLHLSFILIHFVEFKSFGTKKIIIAARSAPEIP